MPNHEDQLNILYQKVQQLAKRYNALQKENISLKKELGKKNSQYTSSLLEIEKLQHRADSLNLSTGIWNEEDKKQLQKRIDGYLREIDKCLQLLNK